jgi:hypothetical protein
MKGWHNEGYRHSLAAKGIRTSMKSKFNFQRFEFDKDEHDRVTEMLEKDELMRQKRKKANRMTPYYVERYMIDPKTGKWRGKTSDAFLSREEAEARLAEVKAGPRVDPFISEDAQPPESEINFRVMMGENIVDVLRDINDRGPRGKFMDWGRNSAREARVRRLRQIREDEGRAEAVVDEAERAGIESAMQFEE